MKGNLLEKVFLSYRIQRLPAATSPATEWKGCVQLVETFLTNAPAQFPHKFESNKMNTPRSRSYQGMIHAFWSFAEEHNASSNGEASSAVEVCFRGAK